MILSHLWIHFCAQLYTHHSRWYNNCLMTFRSSRELPCKVPSEISHLKPILQNITTENYVMYKYIHIRIHMTYMYVYIYMYVNTYI